MRHAAAAILIAVSLVAAPVQAKEPSGFIASIPHDFMTGARFYFETIGGWFTTLLDLLGLTEKLTIVDEGEDCTQFTRCSLGLVCVNACDGPECAVHAKRCLKGPESVNVLGEYSLCDKDNLCSGDTFCTRVCPLGADCGEATHRCLRRNTPTTGCRSDADCSESCGKTPFPPIGPSAWRASCTLGSCTCSPVAIDPAASRVVCPTNAVGVMVCPVGTREACTPAACASGDCPPYRTCVNAPEYGGTCFDDAECAAAACAEGASSFCDPNERLCKCRSSETKTIACAAASDCAASSACATNEINACIEGACACAPAGVVTSCSSASECSSNCPTGYGAACVEGQCACQRVTENVPVACQTLDQCGGVSCPAGFDKACVDAKCACKRQVPQE